MCQAYDQQVAKDDKTHMRAALSIFNPVLGQRIDQWFFLAIAINAQNSITKESWINSFKKVNMHPHTRSSFDEWIRTLDDRGFLSAEKFFEKRYTLYDAMPAYWKRLDVEQRQSVMRIIRTAYSSTPSNQSVWTKQNILSLTKFVTLQDVFKLRTCYLTAKVDPSVIVRLEDEQPSSSQHDSASPIDEFCSWKPSYLVTKYQENKTDVSIQKEFFLHVTNYVAQQYWDIGHANVAPSDYLDIEMSDNQQTLLNPTQKDVLFGFIAYDAKGKGAVQKIAKRRLNVIEGNVNSYSNCLITRKE